MQPFRIGEDPLTLTALCSVARQRRRVVLSPSARERIGHARAVIDDIIAQGDSAPSVYGVNTGFGFLADVRISAREIAALQRNLIRSHAVGVGPALSIEVVRAMLLLRAVTLSRGHSGVRALVVERLCDFLNHGIHPVVPSRGSVGASGDLAPLAHLALALIGEGEVQYGPPGSETVRPTEDVLSQTGIAPVVLSAREGLALVNGTQCMTAIGGLALHDALDACLLADVMGALSLEALLGTPRAFDARVQSVRPHPGQAQSAANLRRLLTDSAIVASHKDCAKVQDAYSLRCMPQVHGASRDALDYAQGVLLREMASATDNPLIFPFPMPGPGLSHGTDEDVAGAAIISGGNFHGQPVALALDFAAIATAELASIAERRIEQLMNPHTSSGLPAFLTPSSGLNSGFMMAHVTAAALVSDNKILAHPASVDSIPTSAGREDHVSMGVHAADKFARIVDNVRNVMAIEFLCAAQGVHFRRPLRSSRPLQAACDRLHEKVPPLAEDRPLYRDIAAARAIIDDPGFLSIVRQHAELA